MLKFKLREPFESPVINRLAYFEDSYKNGKGACIVRKKGILVSLILLIATDVQGKKESVNTGSPWQHNFSLGVEIQKYYYKEPDIDQIYEPEGTRWMNQKGQTIGLSGSYKLMWKNIIFIQPEGRILIGNEAYNGGQGKEIYSKTKRKISDLILEPRFLVGGKIQLIGQSSISPYAGIGYRFKSDAGDEVKTNRGTFLAYRKSNYVYLPLGTYVDYTINDTWSVSLKGEYDVLIKGWHYDRTLTTSSVTFKQKNGYGLKGEISVAYQYNKLKFSVSPYVNYWNIRNSKKAYVLDSELGGGYSKEPYNVTLESGIKLGVAF